MSEGTSIWSKEEERKILALRGLKFAILPEMEDWGKAIDEQLKKTENELIRILALKLKRGLLREKKKATELALKHSWSFLESGDDSDGSFTKDFLKMDVAAREELIAVNQELIDLISAFVEEAKQDAVAGA